jgi:hypothetical protein
MSKRRQEYSNADFDSEGNFDLEAVIENREFDRQWRGESKVVYVAPKDDQKWRARDLIDIHWGLTKIETPSPSYNRIMSCIIGHANPKDGVCYVRQKLIAIETGYSRDTVKRAVKWWKAQGFLETESRGLAHALAYHPQWDLLEMHWIAASEDIQAQKQAWRVEVHQGAPREVHQGAPRRGAPRCTTESQSSNLKGESHPERAHTPSERDAINGSGSPFGPDGQGSPSPEDSIQVSDANVVRLPTSQPITVRPEGHCLSQEERDAHVATAESRLGRRFGPGRRVGSARR